MEDQYVRKAKIINVVDGDTVDAIVDLGYYINITVRFRFLNIDTPEIRSKDNKKALEAKQYVIDKLLNKEVYIQSFKSDSFGRWLCYIWYNENDECINLNDECINLNDSLVILGYAKVYEK